MREILKVMAYGLILFLLAVMVLIVYMTWMPSPDLEISEKKAKAEMVGLKERLRTHVVNLSRSSVGRNYINEDTLTPARDYIVRQFSDVGFVPSKHTYKLDGDEYSNIIVDIPSITGSSAVLIVGAHYDSVENSPGANDNASGVAALIEIGRYLSSNSPANNNIRLIAFANEEPPFFLTEEMGSLVYARSISNANENILGMISLETIGYYTEETDSQIYPGLFKHFYPSTGNFISFVGNFKSRKLLTSSVSLFRKNSSFPSEGIVSPAFVPGVGWSDHWSFWVTGHNAIMVTDTAPYRYEHYHQKTDTADKLNYEQYSKVVYGLYKVIEGLAKEGL